MNKIIWAALVLIFAACSTQLPKRETSLSFTRKQTINDDWKFHQGDSVGLQTTKMDDSGWRTVTLPHDWAIEGLFSKDNASSTGYLPGGIAWYRKTLSIEDFSTNKEYCLLFDGAYQNAEVWINDHYLGKRPYGYSSFYYDVTPFLKSDSVNLIAVKLDHSIVADSRWYTGNGIYRNVWLVTTNKLHVAQWGTFLTTPVVTNDSAEVVTEVQVENDNLEPVNFELTSILRNKAGDENARVVKSVLLSANADSTIRFSQKVMNPELWSPESPVMYYSEVYIHLGDGSIADRVETPFGIRQLTFTADKGFFCNEKSYKLKGVCMHHCYGALGAARYPEAMYPVLKKLKEAGCNAIRTSHNPEDPEYLNMLDTMGFFVMEEAFDEFKRGKKKWIKGRNVGQRLGVKAYPEYYDRHGYSDFYEEWAQRDIQDMVHRDRNHPSIIMWSVGNETDYPNDPYQDPNVKSTFDPTLPTADEIAEMDKDLVGWIKALDTTRVVTQALANTPVTNAVGVPELLDVVGYNYQENYYKQDHQKYPNRVIYGSENDDNPDAWKAVRDNEFIAGQFLWTGMDYHGEAGMFPSHSFEGGLIDYCGWEKPVYFFRKSLWTNEPMAKLAVYKKSPWNQKMHLNWSEGDQLQVTCFTNCDEAELFLNSRSLGRKKLDQKSLTINWNVPYEKGTLKVEAYRDGKLLAGDELKTAGKAAQLKLHPTVVHSAKFAYDIIQIEVDLVDADGVVIPTGDSQIDFSLNGNGEILGVCNSDYESLEPYKSNSRKLYEGRCLVIVKSSNTDSLVVNVKSEELNQEVQWAGAMQNNQ